MPPAAIAHVRRRALARARAATSPAAEQSPPELVGEVIDLVADLALGVKFAFALDSRVVVPDRTRRELLDHVLGLSAAAVDALHAALAGHAAAHGYGLLPWTEAVLAAVHDRRAAGPEDAVGLVRRLGHELAGASVALVQDRMAVAEHLARAGTEALLVFARAEAAAIGED